MEGVQEEGSQSEAVPGEGRGVLVLAGGAAPFTACLRRWLVDGPAGDRVRLAVRSGDAATDATLAALAPAFVAMLEHLTDRQREVARLLLLEGRRRAQIAEALGISRPTVSVMVDRARLEDLAGVAGALDAIFAAAAASAPQGSAPQGSAPQGSARVAPEGGWGA